jgi:hypothetical protein
MICPNCRLEYRMGATHCSDCDVALVPEMPVHVPPAPPAEPGDPNEDPFCSFWQGEDPRVHVELCSVLDDAGIPHKSLFRSDHLFGLSNYSAFELGVPFSLYEKAEAAVKAVFGSDEYDAMNALSGMQLPDDSDANAKLLPDSTNPNSSFATPPDARSTSDKYWYPEDATVKVWLSEDQTPADFLVAALRENRIYSRVENAGNRAEIYVAPEDEARAKEIVREVRDATPPE